MSFQVKMPENTTKNIFRDKHTTKMLPPIFLDANVLTDR